VIDSFKDKKKEHSEKGSDKASTSSEKGKSRKRDEASQWKKDKEQLLDQIAKLELALADRRGHEEAHATGTYQAVYSASLSKGLVSPS